MKHCIRCRKGIEHGTHCKDCGLKCLYCGTFNSPLLKACNLCGKPLFKPEASNPGVLRMVYAEMTAAQSQNATDTQGLCASRMRILFSGPDVLLMVNGKVWQKVTHDEWREVMG